MRRAHGCSRHGFNWNLESGGIREVSVFDFSGSEVPEGENWICLSVRYRVLLLEGLIPLPAVRMKNQAYIRAWTGYAPGENTEEVSEAGEAEISAL